MRISPISYASFRGGSLTINIQGMKPEELYNYNEYNAFAMRRNADITIEQIPKLISFSLPNHNHFSITVTEKINGQDMVGHVTVSLRKNTTMSEIESEIRKAVYQAFMQIDEKLNLMFVKNPKLLNILKK